MNKDNLYIGVYKETNEESLFYKNSDEDYKDLKNHNKKVASENLDIPSLISFSTLDKSIEAKTRFGALKIYNQDRLQQVSLSRVFIGNVYQITEISERKRSGSNWWDYTVETSFKAHIIKKGALLLATMSMPKYSDFIDLENNQLYKIEFAPEESDYYIPTDASKLKLVGSILKISDSTVEKGKLLEKYREYKRSISNES